MFPANYGPALPTHYAQPASDPSQNQYSSSHLHATRKLHIKKTELEITLEEQLLDGSRTMRKTTHMHSQELTVEESLDIVLQNHGMPQHVLVEQLPAPDYQTMQVNVYNASPSSSPASSQPIASYHVPLQGYPERRLDDITDTTRFLPVKHQIFEFMPDGLFGYTFIGSDKVYINQKLQGERKEETIIHESIHTPDEYETRILTSWILDKKTNKYVISTMFSKHDDKHHEKRH